MGFVSIEPLWTVFLLKSIMDGLGLFLMGSIRLFIKKLQIKLLKVMFRRMMWTRQRKSHWFLCQLDVKRWKLSIFPSCNMNVSFASKHTFCILTPIHNKNSTNHHLTKRNASAKWVTLWTKKAFVLYAHRTQQTASPRSKFRHQYKQHFRQDRPFLKVGLCWSLCKLLTIDTSIISWAQYKIFMSV